MCKSLRFPLVSFALVFMAPMIACSSGSDPNAASNRLILTDAESNSFPTPVPPGTPFTVIPNVEKYFPCAGYTEDGPLGCSKTVICQSGPFTESLGATLVSATCTGCNVTTHDNGTFDVESDDETIATLYVQMHPNDGSDDVSGTFGVEFKTPEVVDAGDTDTQDF